MVTAEKAYYYKAVFQLILPLLFSVPAFLYISPFTTWFPQVVNIQSVYFGLVFGMIGLAYLAEALLTSVPIMVQGGLHKRQSFGVPLFGGFAMFSFVLGGLIGSGIYNFSNETLNNIASFLLGISVLLFAYALIFGAKKKSPLTHVLGLSR